MGEDVFNVEPVKKKLYAHYYLTHLHIHAANWALNAIEMALWDLVGKGCGKPLYKIWGGAFRKKIPYYGPIQRTTPEKVALQAVDLVKRGFKTLYLKVGYDTEEDIDCVKAIPKDKVGFNLEIPSVEDVLRALKIMDDSALRHKAAYNLALDSGLRLIQH